MISKLAALLALFLTTFACTKREESPTPPFKKSELKELGITLPSPEKPKTLEKRKTPPTIAETKKSCDWARLKNDKDFELIQKWNEAVYLKGSERIQHINQFKDQHGLFLRTGNKAGSVSLTWPDGPCGPTSRSLIKKLDKGTDEIYELDEKGKKINTWKVPYERTPIAIKINQLIFRMDFREMCSPCSREACHKVAAFLMVNPDGSFSISFDPQNLNSLSKGKKCPKSDLYKDSDYRRCFSLKDIETKKDRVFLGQAPCT